MSEVDDRGSGEEAPSSSGSSSPEKCSTEGGNSSLHQLYDKYTAREREMERIEKQNEEYREQLIRVIRERDLNDELLRNVRAERQTKFDELERKILEYESQLRVVKDRASAQELHFQTTTKDMTTKFNNQVAALTKKAEAAENEKNQAVIKYAMKEAEIMKLNAIAVKKDEEIKALTTERDNLRSSSSQQRTEELEKKNMDLSVELEKVKHERFDFENKCKLAEKRADVCQITITDHRQQIDVLRRNLIQLKDEKASLAEDVKVLMIRLQAEEQRLRSEEERVEKEQSSKEQLYKNLIKDAAAAKQMNTEHSQEIEALNKEKVKLLSDLQAMEDKLKDTENKNAEMEKRLKELEGIEKRVNSAIENERDALKAREEAEADKNVAEEEAAECRKQAERMLEITQQLTQRNTTVSAELTEYREKQAGLQEKIVELEGANSRAQTQLTVVEEDLSALRATSSAEIESLKSELSLKITKVHELTVALNEEKNDFAAFKKKQAANMKELKNEASSLKKQLAQQTPTMDTIEVPTCASAMASGSSRASSITSVDQIGKREDSLSGRAQSPLDEGPPNQVQQAMLDKIIKLQKQLARRAEKIEFLEEHVRQCLDELQKKSKIIQYYTLREEASLLLPEDDSLQKLMDCCEVVQVPLAKKGTAYALMGSMFSNGNSKTSLQLATEINSRLQAVLEDTLIKNINLKNNVDTLGEEISRLSRENRQLTLVKR